ncbi:helix-turn-helix domain-containing protein [Methanothermococcus thermolithotrophicus]|uniref:helix-turn-helix domain-containing protein n=1 Tax=Methanothermococcus thermolithotrophicus TaxID=2186 RepID=UPI00037E14DD|nr:helix-turn-helix domain-containing protein [Methanothermococcus thermolithotrophicus]
MIEKDVNKIVSWDEINKIIADSNKDLVFIRMPESVFNHPKMAYKIQVLKENTRIFIEVKSKQRGRKRKINETQKRELLNLIKEGHSIRKTAKMVGISKSTVYEYVKDDMISMKKEQLKELIYEFKEVFIENDLYDIGSVQILLRELEQAVEIGDLNRAYELLSELREYFE